MIQKPEEIIDEEIKETPEEIIQEKEMEEDPMAIEGLGREGLVDGLEGKKSLGKSTMASNGSETTKIVTGIGAQTNS
jgi:hypothetical protein